MTPYTWGLVVVALVAYALGSVRVHRFVMPATFRALRRRSIEKRSREAFAWNARRRVRLVIEEPCARHHRVRRVAQSELGKLAEYLLDLSREGDPCGVPERRWQVAPGDVVRVELAGVTDVEPVAELGRFEVTP